MMVVSESFTSSLISGSFSHVSISDTSSIVRLCLSGNKILNFWDNFFTGEPVGVAVVASVVVAVLVVTVVVAYVVVASVVGVLSNRHIKLSLLDMPSAPAVSIRNLGGSRFSFH